MRRNQPSGLADVAGRIARAIELRRTQRVAPAIDEAALAARLASYDFAQPRALDEVTRDLLDLLTQYAVRSDHPRYFGLFNPPALIPAIAGDWIASAINPQLAVWSHAPAAAEIERKLVLLFGRWIWSEHTVAGTFTSGGSEANLTALLVALQGRYPRWHQDGIPRTGRPPGVFVSSESHLAWIKIARMCGLGSQAVHLVSPADGLALSGAQMQAALSSAAAEPVLVVATAGTTAHGSIDDLAGIAAAGHAHHAHVHVDAAWAGGALLHGPARPLFNGIEAADSVTVDPHKWLAVPMGAGLFLSRSWQGLERTFDVANGYMPSASTEHRDAYIHSVQWSRRFIGAKLFASLATMGLPGYQQMIARQFELGARLRARLSEEHWQIDNCTALPLICFSPRFDGERRALLIRRIAERVIRDGAAWISVATLRGQLVLRACIRSFETCEDDLEALLKSLNAARTAALTEVT